jgi:DNA topoisomerase-2
MDNILSFAAFKSQKELKKSDGAKRSRLTGAFCCGSGSQRGFTRLIGARVFAHDRHATNIHTTTKPTTGITKLSDANDAGTRGSLDCTLILTEGDSAKSLAMSGLSVVGHDRWGVFPLRCAEFGFGWGLGGQG